MKRIKFYLLVWLVFLGIFSQSITEAAGFFSEEHASSVLSRQEIADRLGWIPVSDSDNVCKGYYREEAFDETTDQKIPLNAAPIKIDADETEFLQSGRSTLLGKVKLSQPNRVLNADKVNLNRDAQTKRFTSADLIGDVIVREPGRLLVSRQAHIQLTNRTGSLEEALYRIKLENNSLFSYSHQLLPKYDSTRSKLSAWGRASAAQTTDKNVLILKKASYTTCPPYISS